MKVGTRITGVASVVGQWTQQIEGVVTEVDATPDEYGNVVVASLTTPSGIKRDARIGEVVDGVWAGYVVGRAAVEIQAYPVA